MIPPGAVIYASDATDAGVASAREWIRAQGLTADDCKLVKRQIEDTELCVVVSKKSGLRLT